MAVLDPYGLRRVVSPAGVLPQAADKLDPHLPLADDELEIAVEHLNIDAASFRQLEASEKTPDAIARRIDEIVATRGKMQNPVTGSGGMLLGRVKRIGVAHPAFGKLHESDRIASLVSLTLTPLSFTRIRAVHPHAERIDVDGTAILFATGAFAVLPDDLPELVSLAVLDVCGAPLWASRLACTGQTVLVIGAGKSGALVCAALREQQVGCILVLDLNAEGPRRLVEMNLADTPLTGDATRPLDVLRAVEQATQGVLADLVINCASVPGTELASILSTRPGGEVLFFSMATSFSAAALGAEGVGRDVRLVIGNGYAAGHAEYALNLVRRNPELRKLFEKRVG